MDRILILALLLTGCASPAPPPAETDAVEQPIVPEPVVAPPSPAAEPKVEGELCRPYDDQRSIERWRERVISRLNTRDHEGAVEQLKCIDPSFSAPLFDRAVEWQVDAIPRHLDADPEEEWVLQFRQYTETVDGQREELVWIAVLDKQGDEHRLAGVIVRPKLAACLVDDMAGLSLDYTSEVAGEDAAMLVVEQQVKSCGKRPDVIHHKTSQRVRAGKLVSEPL